MKNLFVLFFLVQTFCPELSTGQESLIGGPMPLLANKTLDGKTIDSNYYRGHITLVSFMFIGCSPCMKEITILNNIKNEYNGNNKFQILCVASQMRQQMIDFNSNNNKTQIGKLRRLLAVDSITYSIQPACNDSTARYSNTETNITLGVECNAIEFKYGITTFPTIIYVDKNGAVRKIDNIGPASKNDTTFYNKIKKEIDLLLAE